MKSFRVEPDLAGSWRVVDSADGRTVSIDDRAMEGMQHHAAEEMACLLTQLEHVAAKIKKLACCADASLAAATHAVH